MGDRAGIQNFDPGAGGRHKNVAAFQLLNHKVCTFYNRRLTQIVRPISEVNELEQGDRGDKCRVT